METSGPHLEYFKGPYWQSVGCVIPSPGRSGQREPLKAWIPNLVFPMTDLRWSSPFPLCVCIVALHLTPTSMSPYPPPPGLQGSRTKALIARGWQWQLGLMSWRFPQETNLCFKRCDNTQRFFPGVSDPTRHLLSIFRGPGQEQISSSTCFFTMTYLICRNGAFFFLYNKCYIYDVICFSIPVR